MVLHVLYSEKENGNVPYHLPEKRVVPVEKQMKRSTFSGTCNCGQIVDKWYRNFRAFRSKREKGNASKGITFFPKTFHRDEPFHLNSLRNFRKFHSNGKRSLFGSRFKILSSFSCGSQPDSSLYTWYPRMYDTTVKKDPSKDAIIYLQ